MDATWNRDNSSIEKRGRRLPKTKRDNVVGDTDQLEWRIAFTAIKNEITDQLSLISNKIKSLGHYNRQC